MKKISKLKVLIFSVLFSTLENFFEKNVHLCEFLVLTFLLYRYKVTDKWKMSNITPDTNNEETEKKSIDENF